MASRQEIRDWLLDKLAEELGYAPEELDPREPFESFGLSSRMAVGIVGDLEEFLDQQLEPILLWEHPTVEELAAHLADDAPETAATPTASDAGNPSAANTAVAIVGLGCRFPGAEGPEAFWQLLIDGRDAVSQVPANRWDADALYDPESRKPGTMYTREAGFVRDIDCFDPAFFGISPREADRMDPQQRMVLETTWHALEDAGIRPDILAGSATGVFVGISTSDYGQFQFDDSEQIDAYIGTGNAHSIAANRLSYVLDLRGPSVAVDTACSSSLVAVHQALQSLRTGESNVAIAAGVNAILTPAYSVVFSQARMLAPDGRCKTFDERADGYGRGEGCGVVILKRLADAERDGDRIYAVLRGSAVNQDGRSNGLTAPNGMAQRDVIQRALRDANVTPDSVAYVEAHGTGTPLGDPIEIEALKAVLMEKRTPVHPLRVGSAKTNVGHLEAGAGMVGLIKCALSLYHETIPRHLHFKSLNPHINLRDTALEIPTENCPWPRTDTPRRAGVSSFGFGGTNAHVILEEAPPTHDVPASPWSRDAHVLTLSARDDAALKRMAHDCAEAMTEDTALGDFCHTANTTRARFDLRFATVAGSAGEMRDNLRAFAETGRSGGNVGSRPRTDRRLAFLFTGQGAQKQGMARRLFETSPVFREALEHCDALLRDHSEVPLLDVIYSEDPDDGRIDQTQYTQPALFSIEYALANLWQHWGVQPAAVTGHSVGEYAAACVAGAFSLEDGLRLIAERGRLMQALPAGGGMAAVLAPREAVEAALKDAPGQVAIAALNGPANTVLSGKDDALKAVLDRLESEGYQIRRLAVSHAFHSPLIEPMLDAFEAFAGGIAFHPLRLPLASNLTGKLMQPGEVLDARYWRNHIRQPVRFATGMTALAEAGYDLFLEAGPHPVLCGMGAQCLNGQAAAWLPSLRHDTDDWRVLSETSGRLFLQGIEPDWRAVDAPYAPKRCAVPRYPFARDRHWFTPKADARAITARPGSAVEAAPCYRHMWQAWTPVADAALSPGRWVILADAQGTGDALADQLRDAGHAVACVKTTASGDDHQLARDDFEAYSQTLNNALTALDSALPFHGIVHAWALDDAANGPGAGGSLMSLLATVQALAHLDHNVTGGNEDARVWVITAKAQAVADDDDPAPAQATIWGFGRSLALEMPTRWGGILDVDANATSDTAHLLTWIAASAGENEVALRGGAMYRSRLSTYAPDSAPPLQLDPDKRYLITGAFGGLGQAVVRWMVSVGARKFVLVVRALPDAEDVDRQSFLEALKAEGCDCRLVAVDLSDTEALRQTLQGLNVPVHGVLHCAGTLNDQSVYNLTPEALNAVYRPKAEAALTLDAWLLDQAQAPDFFVSFSSAAALMGSPGQSNYAAANAVLDALAWSQHRRGWRALSVNWGPWSDIGMAARGGTLNRLARIGITPVAPASALKTLRKLLAGDQPVVGVIDADWVCFQSALMLPQGLPMLRELAPAKPAGAEAEVAHAHGHDAPAVKRFLREQAALVLHIPLDSVAADAAFTDLGMDSIMAMEVITAIEREYGLRLFPKEMFEHPTPADLAAYLAGELAGSTTVASASEHPTQPVTGVAPPRSLARARRPETKNPQAVFVLSAPRTGSTLMRVMLAGNPALFSPPELHLLPFADMAARREELGESYLTEGLERTLMELEGLDAEAAQAVVADLTASGTPVYEVYRRLQDRCGQRLLVDKSPSYSQHYEVLEQAEKVFTNAKYIHLTRHPYAMIESFTRNRFERLTGGGGDPAQLAENMWCASTGNVIDFFETLPDDRCFTLRYEDLVADPEKHMRAVCDFLEVPYDPAMIEPYTGDRMTDGVHAESAGIGDPNFLKRKGIDPRLGQAWRRIRLGRRLGGYARRLAAELRYDLPHEGGEAHAPQQVVPIRADGDKPPLFVIAPGGGVAFPYYNLAEYLEPGRPFYALQDPSLDPAIEMFTRVEDLAEEHIIALKNQQPEGPYYLAGWSFGGAVAYEMACQLTAAGDEVAFLGIIDTEAPGATRTSRLVSAENARQLLSNVRLLCNVFSHTWPYVRDGLYLVFAAARRKKPAQHKGSAGALDYVRWAWADAMRRHFMKTADVADVATQESRLMLVRMPATQRILRVLRANLSAMKNYRPRPYSGHAVLFRAEDQSLMRKRVNDHTMGWGEHVEDRLHVIDLPGNHVVLLSKPYIETFAENLNACLRDADKGNT